MASTVQVAGIRRRCAVCGHGRQSYIRPGEQYVTVDGQDRHLACHERITRKAEAQTRLADRRRNRYADDCSDCGQYVAESQGTIYRCNGSSSGAEHYSCPLDLGRWHVLCAACAA